MFFCLLYVIFMHIFNLFATKFFELENIVIILAFINKK